MSSADVFMTLLWTPDHAAELSAQADALTALDCVDPYETREVLFDAISPSEHGRAEVLEWLGNRGIEPTPVQPPYPLAAFLRCSRQAFAEAFGERARRWLENPHADRPRRIDWQIPARLAGYVQGVQVLRDAEKSRHWLDGNCFLAVAATENHGVLHDQAGPPAMPSGFGGMGPADIARIYDFPAEWDGSGETIALLLLDAAPDPVECDAFWRAHGIVREPPQVVHIGPAPSQAPDKAEAMEAAMGVQWAGAMAPGARIVTYVMDRQIIADKWAAFLMASVADSSWRPTIAVTSWLIPERDYYAAYGSRVITGLLDQCAVLGISVVAAAGDWGAYDGVPRTQSNGYPVSDAPWPRAVFPACEERVLGVGGTMITEVDPLTELAWSGPLPPGWGGRSPLSRMAGGGGFSAEVPIPDWQGFQVINHEKRVHKPYSRGPHAPAVLAYGRGVPDVSIMAVGDSVQRRPSEAPSARGYRALVSGRWVDFAGGTSVGAPIWGALLARINQARRAAGLRRVGFVNPLLYEIAQKHRYVDSGAPRPFRDIIAGRTDVTIRTIDHGGQPRDVELPGFEAGAFWDPATGLGVPRGTALLDAVVAHGKEMAEKAAAEARRVEEEA
ncbi:MAG: S53 family peptidase [Myxococcales bacterium]|nr:S53 family peptidase [Myxococcales bacterium]MCB9542607.1 S53 family peptidase [Myxococcales bacterium]